MKYLLDSNAWIQYLRGKNSLLSNKLRNLLNDDVYLCSIVIAELKYGVLHGSNQYQKNNQQLLDDLRIEYSSLPFDDAAADEAAQIRHELATQGLPIGGNDLLIAGIARVHGLTLVTHNTREFGRIPNLTIEDWQV